ncbi:DnaJ domain [Macleaya cordata]|uniref:DnaJ domain n=1 Tax=Macleaya cordata TaxID=56857 RepID=A0A200QKD3_MACCD|nr:DnaJ domain [Macleaya cordata]
MGDNYTSRSRKSKKKYLKDTSSSPSSSSSLSSDSEASLEKRSRRRHRDDKHRRNIKGSRREKEKTERGQKHGKSKRRRDGKEKKRKEEKRKKRRVSDDGDSSSSGDDKSELTSPKNPEVILGYIMNKFPDMLGDLKQLLQMIDDGQAVDTRGIPNKTLMKILSKLFRSLNLKENDAGIFFLPPKICPTLEVVGPIISSHLRLRGEEVLHSGAPEPLQSLDSNVECKQTTNHAADTQVTEPVSKDESSAARRRVIGPEMPSAELLAAAAKLTEAEAELRNVEVEGDDDLFIGPPPPALVAEAASANEAERFEEVTRIMGVEIESPYDVLGVNWKMSNDNIKKRYWKLSLMVHPDKCSHPQAHQAFIILNKAFKDLQDPDKRKATDQKLKDEEEKEKFNAELKSMREAAQWRRLQGISIAGDDELLEEIKLPPKRDEWMTSLPPERKPGGAPMQSTTSFSRNAKEGRGDTSVWTDTPLDNAQKAKMNYLEAYDQATALASNEEKKRTNSDADLVDQYNRTKRSKTLVQKHQEEAASSRSKRKSKQEPKKGEWEGQHPWKPWDREKDLTAGRQRVNLDSENMVEGLASRFSSGPIQRNFL